MVATKNRWFGAAGRSKSVAPGQTDFTAHPGPGVAVEGTAEVVSKEEVGSAIKDELRAGQSKPVQVSPSVEAQAPVLAPPTPNQAERVRGTLECYAGHVKGLDPLARAGFCDLTAHVEFTSVARAFEENGMGLAGYTDQHHFLTGLLAGAFGDRPPTAKEARELKTLLHPEMLGTSFQVLAVGKGVPDGKLSGFQYARGDRP